MDARVSIGVMSSDITHIRRFPERANDLIQGIHMLSIFRRLMKSEKGATAIEYTLIASLIAVAAITAMGSVGTKINGVLSNVASVMK